MRERSLQVLHNGKTSVDVGVLIEVAVTYAAQPDDLAFVLRNIVRDNVDKRTFARAVKSDDADVFAVVYGQIGVLEQHFVVVHMA